MVTCKEKEEIKRKRERKKERRVTCKEKEEIKRKKKRKKEW